MTTVHPSSAHKAAPQFLIGIDGGGSGTRARLAGSDGAEIGYGEAGPSALGQGVEAAWVQVRLAIDRALAAAAQAAVPESRIALGLGLSGAHSARMANAFLKLAPPYALLVLDSDAGTALRGAHRGRPGAVIAVGTGSVGEALHADGRRVTVGGWGFGIGDEGSGAWLGQRAMQHAHRALDGRDAAGALAGAVWRRAGDQREALLAWCASAGQQAYAGLAPLVFEHAAADAAARALINAAVGELVATARALDPQQQLPLVITGSIGRRLLALLPDDIQQRCVEPAGDAAAGALLAVAERLGAHVQ